MERKNIFKFTPELDESVSEILCDNCLHGKSGRCEYGAGDDEAKPCTAYVCLEELMI